MIMVAFDHILRTNEFMAIVGADVMAESTHLLVVLRDTKIGQRLGINQEITSKSKWLRQRILDARGLTTPGFPLLCIQPQAFRKLWKSALRDMGVPPSYTPILFDEEAPLVRSKPQWVLTWWWMLDRGSTPGVFRNYISSAMADLGSEEFSTSLIRDFHNSFGRNSARQ